MKILSVFGTRPEAIKMAPVLKELGKYKEQITSVVCVTGQHRQMLDQVLALFTIQPNYDLGVMKPNQTLPEITAEILTKFNEILIAEKPDWVLVQGDTTTAMTAALAAFYHKIKVGHIEAGLRSFDKYQPFPEEINRKIATSISELHFAPTELSRQNLLQEAIPAAKILVTGNTVIDALLQVAARDYDWENSPLRAIPRTQKIILVTAHRRENFGAPFVNICSALQTLAQRYPDIHIVYPVHLNPNVQTVVHQTLSKIPNITLLEPLEYLPLVHLMKASHLVITDSGGIQEEAPGLGKPVLVLREVTERPEGVAAGTVKLVGTDTEKIVTAAAQLLDDEAAYQKMSQAVNPYGDGKASARIVQRLLQ